MMFLLYTIHVLICFFLIAVVLLQQGKGADLSVFGGGATQTAFGARGAASVLHKLTVGFFVAFIVTTLAIGVVQSNTSSNVIEGLPEEEISEEVATEPEGALPTEEASEPDAEAAEAGDDADASSEPAADVDAAAPDDVGAGDGEADADGESNN